MRNAYFSFTNIKLFRTFFLLFSFAFFFASCTPTNQNLTDLVGGETKTTTNGPIGNSALSFSPSLKDFGTLAANSGTSSQVFTVTNISTSDVTLGAVTGATVNFTIAAGTCVNHSGLAKGNSCTLTVTFAPITSGQFSTSLSIPYDLVEGGSFYSSVSMLGAGTTLTNFAGLDSISNAGVSSMQLNWTDVASVDSYQIYRITSSGAAIYTSALSSASCVASACSVVIGGLNPVTNYTFRVRATDSNSVQEQNIVGRTATTLVGNLSLSTAAAIIYAGDCATYTVTTLDGSNVPVNMTTTTTAINISATGNGALYSDSGCTTITTTAAIANGQSAKSFYYKNTTSQAITLTAALTTYATSTLNQTIYPSTAAITYSTLDFYPNSIAADNSTTTTFSATLKDSYANPCTNQAVTLTSSRGATDTITGSPATTSAIGLVTFTVKSATIGNPTITLTNGSFTYTKKLYFLSHTPLVDYQARYAKNGVSAGDSTVFTWWKDLFQSATTEDFQLFNFPNPNTLWAGNGGSTLATDPYRLTYSSASSRYAEGTNVLNSGSDAFIETWVRPSSSATKGSVVLSNGDSSNKGLVIKQSSVDAGLVEVKFGSSRSYADEVLADAPTSYWRFNEPSGLTASDSMGLANGTYNTLGVTYNQSSALTNENNNAVLLNGSTGVVKLIGATSDFAFIQNTGVFAVEFWAKTTDNTNATERLPIANSSTGAHKGFFIDYAPGGNKKFYAVLINGTTSFGQVNMPNNSITDNNWHHIVFTGDGSSTYLYLDGAQVATATFAAISLSSGNSWGQLAIGDCGDTIGTFPWYGALDEVAIYPTFLSTTRALAHYNARTRAVCSSRSSLTNSSWSHIASSFNSTSGAFKLFFNGTQECALTLAGPASLYTGSTSPLAAGAHVDSGGTPTAGTYWSGDVAEIRGSNTAITNAQAVDHYNTSSGNYPAFTPNNITGLRLWLDATDAATLYQADNCAGALSAITGDVVGCWKDKSTNALNATQAAAGTKPKLETSSINSVASVRFGASAINYLVTPATNLNARTQFVVLKIRGNSQGGTHSVLLQNNAPWYQLYGADNTTWYFYNVATFYNSGFSNAASTQLLSISIGTSLTMRLNGSAQIYNANTTSSAHNNAFTIGGWGASYGMNGDISEILIYDTQLSETDIKRVEAYLNAKYKLY